MPYRRIKVKNDRTDDIILLWAVQSQSQWRSISTELSPERHSGQPPHSSQRSGGCSTTAEEREERRSWQHPSRRGPNRLRRSNYFCHDNLRQDLADRRKANPKNPVLCHHTSRERRPAIVLELPSDQLHQPSKRSHAEDHTEQIEATSEKDHCWGKGRLQSRKGRHHRADLQPKDVTPPLNPQYFVSFVLFW